MAPSDTDAGHNARLTIQLRVIKMNIQENEQFVLNSFFKKAERRFSRIIGQFSNEEKSILAEASRLFEGMLPCMAYIDKTDHPMAASVFSSCATLSVYLSLKERGIKVHDFGRAMLTDMEQSTMKPVDIGSDPKILKEFIESGELSKKRAKPNEYIFEAFEGDHEKFDWGVIIKRCALCHAFSQYNAMDLVPYMCAMNDVMSDKINQGLRRTGTIGLGAQQCVYRYKINGEPKRLADQFPNQIRFSHNG